MPLLPPFETQVFSDVHFLATSAADELLACVQVHVVLDDGRKHLLPPIDGVKALHQFQEAQRIVDPFGFSNIFLKPSSSRDRLH